MAQAIDHFIHTTTHMTPFSLFRVHLYHLQSSALHFPHISPDLVSVPKNKHPRFVTQQQKNISRWFSFISFRDGAVEVGSTGGEAEDGWGPDGANGERKSEGDASGADAGVEDGGRGHAGDNGRT